MPQGPGVAPRGASGVNEGSLPFNNEENEITAERVEEERRLMYVGITRARLTLG